MVDRLDRCLFEPEVYNGDQDEDGCPDANQEQFSRVWFRHVYEEPSRNPGSLMWKYSSSSR